MVSSKQARVETTLDHLLRSINENNRLRSKSPIGNTISKVQYIQISGKIALMLPILEEVNLNGNEFRVFNQADKCQNTIAKTISRRINLS